MPHYLGLIWDIQIWADSTIHKIYSGFSILKYGFCNKLISERWTSDQLNTWNIFLDVIAEYNSIHVQKGGWICCKKCSTGQRQINFLSVAKVVFQCYQFSKQFFSSLSRIKYLDFFITFCFVVSLEKMVTLTNNIVYKKSAQYRKYIWNRPKQMKISWKFFRRFVVTEFLKTCDEH